MTPLRSADIKPSSDRLEWEARTRLPVLALVFSLVIAACSNTPDTPGNLTVTGLQGPTGPAGPAGAGASDRPAPRARPGQRE